VKLKIAPCQQILEEQGYLILASSIERSVGEVLPMAGQGASGYEDIPGPLLIVGFATYAEYIGQGRRYNPLHEHATHRKWPHYVKVVAE
jgi:hypothetical protein